MQHPPTFQRAAVRAPNARQPSKQPDTLRREAGQRSEAEKVVCVGAKAKRAAGTRSGERATRSTPVSERAAAADGEARTQPVAM
jgi:hypothetical protein